MGRNAAVDRAYERHRRSQGKDLPESAVVKPCPMTGPLGPIPLCRATMTAWQPGMVARGYALEDAESIRPEYASANGFANETGRDGGDDARHRRRLARPSAWSARRGGTSETLRDARRMAHNPEVEGSNPSPATKARGPLSNRKRASGPSFVNRLCKRGARLRCLASTRADRRGLVLARRAGDLE